jgi:hypothetical protein
MYVRQTLDFKKKKGVCWTSANALGRMNGLGSIERCLETRMNASFHDFIIQFVPRFVPRYCFRYSVKPLYVLALVWPARLASRSGWAWPSSAGPAVLALAVAVMPGSHGA